VSGAQDHWHFPQPDAAGGFRRQRPVVGRRDCQRADGMRAARKAPHFPAILRARTLLEAMTPPERLALEVSAPQAARDTPPAREAVPLPRCMPAGGNKRAAGPSTPAAPG